MEGDGAWSSLRGRLLLRRLVSEYLIPDPSGLPAAGRSFVST